MDRTRTSIMANGYFRTLNTTKRVFDSYRGISGSCERVFFKQCPRPTYRTRRNAALAMDDEIRRNLSNMIFNNERQFICVRLSLLRHTRVYIYDDVTCTRHRNRTFHTLCVLLSGGHIHRLTHHFFSLFFHMNERFRVIEKTENEKKCTDNK